MRIAAARDGSLERDARLSARGDHAAGVCLRAVFFALIGLCLAGCSSTWHRRDWSNYNGPGAHYFKQEEITFPHVDDPLEPANRVMAGFDLGLARYVFAPTAGVYRTFVPAYVRKRIYNFGENLLYPRRVLNNLLQAKWKGAWDETRRFAINTTVGVLGLYDPATKMEIQPSDEDFGQTFAKWGWKNSVYLFWPVFGPSTLRDTVGVLPNEVLDVTNYRFPAWYVRKFNELSDEVEDVLRQVQMHYDAYEPARTLYTLDREVDVENYEWRSDNSAPTQALDAIFLTFEDPKFPARGTTRRVELRSTGGRLPYTLWLQPRPAPLVYVIPGLGGHRVGDSALGIAEINYEEGNSVVTVANPTNWEFIAHGSTVRQPGFAPVDSSDLHRALTEIDVELDRRHPGSFTSRRLIGISMGAFQTLFIAATEEQARQHGLLAFDVYVALDAPVNLEHAMLQLDRFYNAPLAFPKEEREERMNEIFAKVLYLSNGDLQPGAELPFTKLEAEFLIGLSFRLDLQFVIIQTQDRHDLGILRTKRSRMRRAPAFREASEYSFMEYMHAFVLRDLADRDPGFTFDEAGAQRMFELSDLRAVAGGLAANDRVRVFANTNDFLLRQEDIEWLQELLGERAHFFPAGGHLGNLHRKAIQEVIHGIVEQADDGEAKAP